MGPDLGGERHHVNERIPLVFAKGEGAAAEQQCRSNRERYVRWIVVFPPQGALARADPLGGFCGAPGARLRLKAAVLLHITDPGELLVRGVSDVACPRQLHLARAPLPCAGPEGVRECSGLGSMPFYD